ncbi:MAG: hypothetical protein OEX97_00650 [Acidimicrobiia bacterium]|nr:hypothetical protein [Acidimicrobiia bacterium]
MRSDPERSRAPLGYILIVSVVGLYLLIRVVEGAICMGDWLMDWGQCPW